MRLICGLFRLDGAAPDEALLRRMAASMVVAPLRPRLATFMDAGVALCVLDFSQAQTPVLRGQSGCIAADVRLDEPDELAGRLSCPPGQPDDELLRGAIERSGPMGLGDVPGDFAFAYWDRDRQSLTCGRDIFGVRPFAYVHRPGKLFAFASFPKALHETGIVPKRLNEAALARQLLRTSGVEDCLIAGVARLAPAHFLRVSRSDLSVERYFEFDRASLGRRRCTPQAAADEMRRLVEQAVACRLPKTGDLGAHLSGGLDSSAISVLAARRLREDGRRLHAFSVLDRQRNDMALEDETEFVKTVLDQEDGIAWTPVRPPTITKVLDAPMDSDRLVRIGPERVEHSICADARAQGVDVILSGWGGQEAVSFGIQGALLDLFRRGKWRTLAHEVSALHRERGWPRWQTLRGHIVSALLPVATVDAANRFLRNRLKVRATLHATLSKRMRSAIAKPDDMQGGFGRDIARNRWDAVNSPHLSEGAETLALIGARYGVAYAFPLLDRRLVAFALSLPHELFLRDGFGRRVFRDAMAGVLPDRIRLRQDKLSPSPTRPIDFAESKEELLAKLDAVGKLETVRRVIDVDHVRREVESFAPAHQYYEELKANKPSQLVRRMAAAVSALTTAIYIEQHGGDADAPKHRRR